MSIEQVFEQTGTGEVCPDCGEEITLSSTPTGQVEVECRCGCTLAAA